MATTKQKNNNEILEKVKSANVGQILVLIAAVVGAYFIGSLSAQVKVYEQNLNNPTQANAALGANPNVQVPQEPAGDIPAPSDSDHVRGNKNSKIALIEYSDYDCPFCAQFHATAEKAVNELDIMWIYRQFPLTQLHPTARAKSIAAECVASQGGDDAFWKFSDILFQEEPGIADLASIVGSKLGLDPAAFTTCLDNEETASIVDAQVSAGMAAGVSGTPGNYIMNLDTGEIMPLRGAVPFETLSNAISTLQ